MPAPFSPEPWEESLTEIESHLESIRNFCVKKKIPFYLTIGIGFDGKNETTYDLGYLPPVSEPARLRAGLKVPVIAALPEIMQSADLVRWPLIALITALRIQEEKERVARGYCSSEVEDSEADKASSDDNG